MADRAEARGGSTAARRFGVIGAASGFLGVAAGAFGAHALRSRLSAELLAVFETAARYQLVHALALVVLSALLGGEHADRTRGRGALVFAGVAFTIGQIVFPGSLDALALTGVRTWGAVTPLGGLAYLAGWVALGVGLARRD